MRHSAAWIARYTGDGGTCLRDAVPLFAVRVHDVDADSREKIEEIPPRRRRYEQRAGLRVDEPAVVEQLSYSCSDLLPGHSPLSLRPDP
jgi:hypothetical protein